MTMRSFLGITAHFGVGNEIFSITLGVYQSSERHTSEHIAEMLLQTCTEWGIDKNKVSAVVTDNPANMVKAIDLAFGKKTHTMFCTHSEFGGTKFYATVY